MICFWYTCMGMCVCVGGVSDMFLVYMYGHVCVWGGVSDMFLVYMYGHVCVGGGVCACVCGLF